MFFARICLETNRNTNARSNLGLHLPSTAETSETATFGVELLTKQLTQVISKLNSSDRTKRKKALKLLDSLATTGPFNLAPSPLFHSN